MSKKSGRLDLLVRVRYQNPLPPPPYPPKLLTIPTDINRLGEPSYLNHLAASTPLPMLVDSEMGMPLNLNEYDGVWEGHEEGLNPQPDAGRVMHPTDLALLAPLKANGGVGGGSAGSQSRDIKLKPEDLATLATSVGQKKQKALGRRRPTYGDVMRTAQEVDASETAQIMSIDSTFFDMTSTNLKTFRHPDPKKRHLEAVESYDVLPDDETWANIYMIVKYPERPSAATVANPNAIPSSPRLRKAFMRPAEDSDGARLIDFYLPEEEDVQQVDQMMKDPISNELIRDLRTNEQIDDDEHFKPNVHYERIRSYEMATVQEDVGKEMLLTIVENEPTQEGDGEPSNKKRKGAYITPIGSKILLRKTRAKRRGEEDSREDIWDRVRLAVREPEQDEEELSKAKRSPMVNQHWIDEQQRKMQGGGDAIVADGEAIDEDAPLGDEEDE